MAKQSDVRHGRARLAVVAAVLGASGAASAATLNEPMTGTTAPGWVIGGAAYLTSSTGVDAPGDGWLRLTSPSNDQAGYAYYDAPFDVTAGGIIQFDYATWGGSGADGYSIFLFDATASFTVGASGGSLGYAQKTVAPLNPGMSLGYIGLGVDEFGNYSSATEGRIGGPGARANAVALRGPYNHPSGAYFYLGGSATLGTALAFNGQGFRPQPTGTQYRKVLMYLTPVAAPNYLRMDVYVQFGFNQPYTSVIASQNVGRPIPTSVKIGYAASTGGSTNYHEIRNLVIDPLPTKIDLAMFKTASSPNAVRGSPLTYTVTVRNYGPSLTTATNVPITDVVPATFTSVTWTCAASGGSSCGAASGSGNNISTTATLPFNTAVVYTITGTVNPAAPLGSTVTNTASLTVPGGLTDYIPANNSASESVTVTGTAVTIWGTVYADADHDGVFDGGETDTNLSGIYAKLFRTTDLSTLVAVATVSGTTGAYTLTGVPSYDDYTLIISSNNAATFTPSFPNANWIYTNPVTYTKSLVSVLGANLTGQDFGVYNGSRIEGKVIKDDGSNGAAANANDGVLNASEVGLTGVSMSLRSNSGATTYDTVTTDANGAFALYTNVASANLRIVEVANPAGYVSVNYGAGTTGGTYTIAGEYVTFAYTQYTEYDGVIFGDVPDKTFTPTPRATTGTALTPVDYAHTFTPGTGGSVTFTTQSRSQGSWAALLYYKDNDCSGTYNGGDTTLSGAQTTVAGVPLCIIVRDTIPSTATNGTTDVIVTRATFTYTNTTGPITGTNDVTDTTTVQASDLSSSTKTWVDLDGGDQDPGDVIRYTITIPETAGVAASGVSVVDNMPANVNTFTVVAIPAGATNGSTSGGGANGTGLLSITNISVPASGSRTIVFDVTIVAGTAPGTLIDNTATITNPAGPGDVPSAPTITVSASAIAGAGMKLLYVYGAGLQLSRTPTPGTPAAVTIAANVTTTWAQTPVLQTSVTLSPTVNASVPVYLYLSANLNRTRTITVSLQCSSGGTTISQGLSINIQTTPTLATFSLPLGGSPLTCAAGNSWRLGINNPNGSGITLSVTPVSGGNYSRVSLPSANVIAVSSVLYYTAAYPGATQMTAGAISPSTVVRVRSVVTDPFGSFDITGATLRITDSLGVVQLAAGAMTQVADSGAATKTYEYAYTVPTAGATGNWLVRVTANEGTEGTITDFSQVVMPVTRPTLTMVKSANVPTAAPGTTITYTIVITNTGLGDATAVVVTDTHSRHLGWKLGSFTFTEGSPASGLSLGTATYSNNNGTTYVYVPVSGGGGAPAGFDNNVTNFILPLNGTMAPNSSTCSVTYQMRIK